MRSKSKPFLLLAAALWALAAITTCSAAQADSPAALGLSGQWTAGLSLRIPSEAGPGEDEPPLSLWQELQLALSARLPGHPKAAESGWQSSFFVKTRYRGESPVGVTPDQAFPAGNTLNVDELWVGLSSPRGLAARAGRLHFQYGPAGLLAANPFDGLAGLELSGSTRPRLRLSGVLARLDTSYVTLLPYVYDTDSYWVVRGEFDPVPGHTLGVTLLGDGLADERGVGVDWQRKSSRHSYAAELAAFRASPGADNFQGWVLGGVLSVDLWQGADFLVNMNLGSIHPGFTPLASNLASAGGELNFSNGTSGLEINTSWLVRRDILIESEFSLLWRWQRPDLRIHGRMTYGAAPGLQYQVAVTWRQAGAGLQTTVSVNQRF
ncbi:MAG: hypothetical protein IMX00_03345 [Limnochordales bacterium]|nr:hypothetical protein [Limnochordales bacterium]